MSDKRPSSTVTRRRCFDYWAQPDGMLICYICKTVIDPKEKDKITGEPKWDAEHEVPRSLSTDPNRDLPPNVKPACRPTCEGHEWGHAEKTSRDIKSFAKSQRIRDKDMGFRRGRSKVPGSKGSGLRKRYNKHTGKWDTVRESDL